MSSTEYIELFDKYFGTHIAEEMKNKQFTMLDWAFDYMGEELYIPSKEHEEIRSKLVKLSDKVLTTYNREQKQLFSDYWELESQMDYDINKQMMAFGFCMAYQQLKEMGALKNDF